MGNAEFMTFCKRIIADYFNAHVDKSETIRLTEDDVYVVWLCKALGNNKALLSTTIPDNKYYEITYNGERCEFYLDVYVKLQNVCIPKEEIFNG